jgi:predicted nucleic-acid-binding protein
VKVIADTNLLLRFFVGDDLAQYELALKTMEQAEAVVVPGVALCEFVWVLRSRYGTAREDIASAIVQLRQTRNIVMDNAAVDAGLAVLADGADFADGMIAYEGRWLGGEVFVSFDKKAVALIEKQGHPARYLE